jgi:hypothetical protein
MVSSWMIMMTLEGHLGSDLLASTTYVSTQASPARMKGMSTRLSPAASWLYGTTSVDSVGISVAVLSVLLPIDLLHPDPQLVPDPPLI